MPGYPVTPAAKTKVEVSVGVIDYRGQKSGTFVKGGADATTAQKNALVTAVGNATNAAVFRDDFATKKYLPNLQTAISFDEASASVNEVLYMSFQNDAGDLENVVLPAPDASLFTDADRSILDPAQDESAALITAIRALLNAATPNPNFAFVRGYITTRKTKKRLPKPQLANFVEPGVGDLPDPAPGA